MKGLWVKDLLLLQKQLKTFLMFVLIAAFNAYTIKSVPVIFIMMAFFFVTTSASTIFYDQENHGFLYLFTLPTRKKDYVIQKLLLVLVSSLVAVGLSFVLIFLMMQFDPDLQTSGEDLLFRHWRLGSVGPRHEDKMAAQAGKAGIPVAIKARHAVRSRRPGATPCLFCVVAGSVS